jgi:hypothetical protein
MKTDSPPPTTTIPSLLHSLREDTTALLQQEVALAKAEINEGAVELAKRVVAIATGGAFLFAGLLLIVFAAGDLVAVGLVNAGVSADIALWLGPLLLGGIIAFVGWGVFAKARNELSARKLAPTETVESMKDNKDWAKEKIQSS